MIVAFTTICGVQVTPLPLQKRSYAFLEIGGSEDPTADFPPYSPGFVPGFVPRLIYIFKSAAYGIRTRLTDLHRDFGRTGQRLSRNLVDATQAQGLASAENAARAPP